MNDLPTKKTVPLKEVRANPEAVLRGSVQIVDDAGQPFGIFLDNTSLDNAFEAWLSSDLEFIESLDASRSSSRVSGIKAKASLGLA